MAAISNYGSIQYGSRQLTIGGTVFIAENISVSRPTKIIENNDELSEPDAFAIVAQRVTGSATVQVPSDNSKPQLGDEFNTTFDDDIGAETYAITSVTDNEDQNNPKKVNVNFILTTF